MLIISQKKCKALEERVARIEKDRVASLLAQPCGENWSLGHSRTIRPSRFPLPLPQRKRKFPHDFDIHIELVASCLVVANVATVPFHKP